MHTSANAPCIPDTTTSPPSLNAVYDLMWKQVVHLEEKWAHYQVLFGTSEQRIQTVMNPALGALSGPIQDALWDSLMMHLARLADNAKFERKTEPAYNVSLKLLVSTLKGTNLENKARQVDEEFSALMNQLTCARNKYYAHNDLATVETLKQGDLQTLSMLEIQKTIGLLKSLLDAVAAQHLQEAAAYHDDGQSREDAMAVVDLLTLGLQARAAQRQAAIQAR